MRINRIFPAVLIAACIFASCEKNADTGMNFTHGVFIVNEGAFNGNNGSVSFLDTATGLITNNIFYDTNGRTLGDIVQSIGLQDGKAFLSVNGSKKLEIVELRSFRTLREPLSFSYPRHFLPLGNHEGYLSNGSMEGKIYVLDTESMSVKDSVEVGFGPENMVLLDNNVYVANSGGWGLDSTISIIDAGSHEVTGTMVVGYVPVDLTADADGNIWVLCKGYSVYSWDPPYDLISETDAHLVKLNPVNRQVLWSTVTGKAGDFVVTPVKIAVSHDGNTIYCLMPGGVYAVGKDETGLPAQPLIEGSYYGLEVNPSNGRIIVFESNFSGSGTVKIYSREGDLLTSLEAGIAPNGAVFF